MLNCYTLFTLLFFKLRVLCASHLLLIFPHVCVPTGTVHPCLNGRAPPYLSDYCAGVDTRQHLRSASRQLLAVLRYRLNTYGRRAFSVAGPTVWNYLPDFIRDPTTSADCFRRLLKTYLFSLDTSAFSALEVLDDNRAL